MISQEIKQKREQFRVQIRKDRREQLLQQKRMATLTPAAQHEVRYDRKIGEIQQGLDSDFVSFAASAAQLIQKYNSFIPQQLEKCYEKEFLELIYLCIKKSVENEDVSMLMMDENLTLLTDQLSHELLSMILNLTYYSNTFWNRIHGERFLDLLIALLTNNKNTQIYRRICQVLSNIVLDTKEVVDLLAACDITQKLVIKSCEIGALQKFEDLGDMLGLISNLTSIERNHFGTKDFKALVPVFCRLRNSGKDSTDYGHCVYSMFSILANLTCEIEQNKPRVHQLFNELISLQVVTWVCDIMMGSSEENIIKTGYTFLLNLSQINASYSMEALLNQTVLTLIQLQINEEEYPQKQIYPLLANLLATDKSSTKQRIIDTGIMGRVSTGYARALENKTKDRYLSEVVWCIVNAFEQATLEQLKELVKADLAKCLVSYLVDQQIEELDGSVCKEVFGVLVQIFKVQPKQSKYNVLRECKKNAVLIMRVQQIQELLDDGSEALSHADSLLDLLLP